MIWKAELEMLNSSNLCSKQSKEFNFACANVHGLKANTTYLFQVQTFNFKFNSDESQSGSWSSEFEARTDEARTDPNEITTRSPKNPNQVIKAVDTKYVDALHSHLILRADAGMSEGGGAYVPPDFQTLRHGLISLDDKVLHLFVVIYDIISISIIEFFVNSTFFL